MIHSAVVGNAVERGDVSFDSTSNWAAVNPVLLKNEQATDTTTGDVRVGNGSTPYLTLTNGVAARISANNTTERAAQSATYVSQPAQGATVGTASLSGGVITLAVTSPWSIDADGNVDYSATNTPPTGYSPAVLSIDPATGSPVITQIAS